MSHLNNSLPPLFHFHPLGTFPDRTGAGDNQPLYYVHNGVRIHQRAAFSPINLQLHECSKSALLCPTFFDDNWIKELQRVGVHQRRAVINPKSPPPRYGGLAEHKCNVETDLDRKLYYYRMCQEVQSLNEKMMQCVCLAWLGLEREESNKENGEGLV